MLCWTHVIKHVFFKHIFNMFGTIFVLNICWTYVQHMNICCTNVAFFPVYNVHVPTLKKIKVFWSVKTILIINLSLVKLTEFCKKCFQFQSVYVSISIRVQHFECIHHISIVIIRQCLQEPTCLDERLKLLIINRSVAW